MNSAVNSVHLTIISQFESLVFLKLGMESKRIKKGSCDSQLEIPFVLLILSTFQFPYL